MKNYERPTIIIDDELSEGVYAASGCYAVTAKVHQKQQVGRGDYRIQVDGVHDSEHTSENQILTVTFNMPVKYKTSNGTLQGSGEGTVISISYKYHQNPKDNIGLGDLVVEADDGLAIVAIRLDD